ncbi:MAG: Serine/threonine-protein kinase PknD [Gemmatimonadaceae bacterium]|nr:Serine/threonine-protein kinase PknD [Gemmatimonadaceae bacterium]
MRAQRLEALLDLILDTEPAERDAVLLAAANDDTLLLAEARALVTALDKSEGFLERSAAAMLGMSEPDPGESSRAGETIGSWRLVRLLGTGGMGSVYLAERVSGGFSQAVALKLVLGGARSTDIRRRFLAERQILAGLQHRNVARLVDGGTLPDGSPWFAMEYVDGARITTWCDQRRLRIAERLAIFEQVAGAVSFAHRNFVVHRDIKPSNILVTADGTVKLLDFGIAKMLGDASPADATLTGHWIMTPEYASPEQVRGGAITTATDVYALGAVLYELLTGHRAHRLHDRSPRELERTICELDAPRASDVAMLDAISAGEEETVSSSQLAERRGTDPSHLRRTLAGDLDTIVARALHKDPDRRYPSVDALLDDLERYRAGLPVRARPDSRIYRLRKFTRRHALGLGAAGALALAIAAGVVSTIWQARSARDEARKARETRDFVVDLFRSANPEESPGRDLTARDLVDRGLHRIDSALAGQPAVQQELLGVLGVTYRELGHLPQARTALERAVLLAEQAMGARSSDLAARLTDLGTVLNSAGEYAAADSVLRRALLIHDARNATNSVDHAATLAEIANNMEDMGDWENAEALHRQILRTDVSRLGPQNLDVATDLNNLGVTLDQLNRFEQADSAYRAALDIRRRLLPPEHPALLTVMENLAVTLAKSGRLAAAESLNRATLAGRRRVLPAGHPDLAYSLTALAANLEDQGRLLEAEALDREALDIRRRMLGSSHPVTLQTANNLAVLLVRAGRYDSAATLFRDVVQQWSMSYGDADLRTATAINNLGVALVNAGKVAEGERLVRQALSLRRSALGDSAADVATSRRNLAVALLRRGQFAEAEQQVRAALTGWATSLPPGHVRFADGWTTLAELALRRGQIADAESLLVAARDLQVRQLSGDDSRRAETAQLLAQARSRMGRLASAESLLVESARIYELFPARRERRDAVARDLARLRAMLR